MPLGAVELYNSNSGAQIKRDGRSPRGRNSSGMCLLFLMSKHTLDRSPIKKKTKKKNLPLKRVIHQNHLNWPIYLKVAKQIKNLNPNRRHKTKGKQLFNVGFDKSLRARAHGE